MKNRRQATSLNDERFERRKSPLRRLIFWIKSRFVQDAPKSIAACEFECHKEACRESDWAHCPRRQAKP